MHEIKPYYSPDHRTVKVEEKHSLADIYRSVAKINLVTAASEIVDNYRDKARAEQPQQLLFQFHPGESRIMIQGVGTTGMDDTEIQQFLRFGSFGREIKEGQIGQHGFGGKEALLWWLDENSSNLRIFSKPASSLETFELVIPNWWKSLKELIEPKKVREIRIERNAEKELLGKTVFELTGVKADHMPKSRVALADLADELGATYAQAIHDKRLSITLQLILGKYDTVEVLPVLVPFLQDHYYGETINERTGRKGEGPRIDVRWGMIDIEQKNQSEAEREKSYKISRRRLPQRVVGNRVFISFLGRRLEEIEFRKLGIPGWTAKYSLDLFAMVVKIIDPVQMDLFKTGAAEASKARADILWKIRKLAGPLIDTVIRESESEKKVPPTYQKKAEEATKILREVLIALFRGETNIGKEFGLKPEEVPILGSERNSLRMGKYEPSLPRGTSSEVSGKEYAKSARETRDQRFSIPEIRASYFHASTPPFEMLQKAEGGKSVIELNLKNAIVKEAFKKNSVIFILDLAGRALYSERVLSKNSDARAFWRAFVEEVDTFMDKVSQIEQS